ncbi:MAG: diguanylate cyclase domain-containing protein [Cetobacterium sp.]
MYRSFLKKYKLISVVVIILVAFISFLSVKQILFRSKELVIFMNNQTVLEINNIIKNQISLIESLSELEYIKNEDIPIQKKALSLKPFQDKYSLLMLALMDKDGNTSSSLEGGIANLSHRNYFKRAKDERRNIVSEIVESCTTGEKTIIIAHPILNPQKEFTGAIFSSIYLSELILIKNRYGAANEAYVTSILDNNLNVILEDDHIELEKELFDNSFGFFFERKGYSLHAITFMKDPVSNWYIVTDLNASKYFFNTWANTLIIVLILVATFLIIFQIFNVHTKKELLPILNSLNQDYLTGIYNRKYLEEFIKKVGFKKNESALIILDIDNFKSINDELGHTTGDYVICETANKIVQIFSEDSIAARVGGDEFIIFVKNCKDRSFVLKRIKSLLFIMDTTYNKENKSVKISTSIGITFIENGDSEFIDLYNKTDAALYKAKKNGKNCACIADSNDEIIRN